MSSHASPKIYQFLLALILLSFTQVGVSANTRQVFKDAASLEDNWYFLDWFGYFLIEDDDWIYHLQHGWMFLSWGDGQGLGKVAGKFWLHDMEMGWWWVDHRSYPYIYSSNHENWLWYVAQSSSPRWFYCFCNCSWESMPATQWVIPEGPPSGFVEIPAGSFNMGQVLDGIHYSVPVHKVTLDKFYIGTHEVTKALWDKVYAWALCNNYNFDNAGLGNTNNHPITEVNWYDAVKWCNAYSQMEHRDPVYYTDSSKSIIYKTGNIDLTSSSVDWDANGFRLPTEAEWEKSSRSGLEGKLYPWGDDQYGFEVNYGHTPGEAIEVGQFDPTNYGLYDIAGNVAEWTWDWLDTYSAEDQANPTGPDSGVNRVYRGGSWKLDFKRIRCADRAESKPWDSVGTIGLRVVISGQ